VLLEVAASVQHLHNMQLLHCDIKPENVLLKSNNSNPLGFTTKLSDFGLAKLLRDNYYIINRSGSGTVTHLAPELFQVGGSCRTGGALIGPQRMAGSCALCWLSVCKARSRSVSVLLLQSKESRGRQVCRHECCCAVMMSAAFS
jgi:serine/threonine protein kinase